MNTAERLEMLDWVLHLNDDVKLQKLRELKAESSSYQQNEIVAYNAVGEPLNIEQYKAHIKEGLDDMKAGRVTSHKDFLDDVKSW